MSGTWFISDLHLDPARPAALLALERFLGDIRGCDALFILGDLFEAWVGDDDDAPVTHQVSSLLRDFTDAGGRLHLMHGNRDFLLGRNFCRRSGASLLEDPCVVDLYGERTLLMHGDSLCTGDTEYQAFRRRARDPAWQARVLGRPLAERRGLALELRRMSHEAASNRAEDIVDVAPSAVAAVMAAHGVRRLIHGHTHRPGRHAEGGGERWVLGDWDSREAAVLKVTSEEISLKNIPMYQ